MYYHEIFDIEVGSIDTYLDVFPEMEEKMQHDFGFFKKIKKYKNRDVYLYIFRLNPRYKYIDIYNFALHIASSLVNRYIYVLVLHRLTRFVVDIDKNVIVLEFVSNSLRSKKHDYQTISSVDDMFAIDIFLRRKITGQRRKSSYMDLYKY